MYRNDKFDVQITKHELQRIDRIINQLAKLSDLEEIVELNFLWSNFYMRELFGYKSEIPKLKFYEKNRF